MTVRMHFKEGIEQVDDQDWHVLAWQRAAMTAATG